MAWENTFSIVNYLVSTLRNFADNTADFLSFVPLTVLIRFLYFSAFDAWKFLSM